MQAVPRLRPYNPYPNQHLAIPYLIPISAEPCHTFAYSSSQPSSLYILFKLATLQTSLIGNQRHDRS